MTIRTNHASVIVIAHTGALAHNVTSDAYLACEIRTADVFQRAVNKSARDTMLLADGWTANDVAHDFDLCDLSAEFAA